MTLHAASRPPAELRMVAVLSFIAGIAQIVAGVLVIFVRYVSGVDATERSVVTIVGAATVLVGLLVVSLASGLLRARRDARILLTVLFGLSFASGGFELVTDADHVWFRMLDLTVTAGIVVVLWTGRVARFFAHTGAV